MESKIEEALTTIAEALDEMAGPEDMASLKINNLGSCYLRVGITHDCTLSIEEASRRIG